MPSTLLADQHRQRRLQDAAEMPDCGCKPKWVYLHFDRTTDGDDPDEESRARNVQWVRCLVPCKHVRTFWKPDSHESCNHSLTLEEWAIWLLLTSPDTYKSRPPAVGPAHCTDRKDRVELMRRRYKHGAALFHPQDKNEFRRLGIVEMQAGDAVLADDTERGRPCKRKR